jgi:hypothetical protein
VTAHTVRADEFAVVGDWLVVLCADRTGRRARTHAYRRDQPDQ